MSFNVSDTLLLMAIILFCLGGLSLLAGIIVLLSRTMNKDIRTLATQTNRLAQKGIIDGFNGIFIGSQQEFHFVFVLQLLSYVN